MAYCMLYWTPMRERFFLTILALWTAAAAAAEIVPSYTPLMALNPKDIRVEFNTDVTLVPQNRNTDRRWYFQKGKAVDASRLDDRDSFCYLGTYGDLYEPKTYHKGESYDGLDLVSNVGNQVYLSNPRHEQLFFRAAREDLFVVGCDATSAAGKPALNAGDLYRHLGYNVLLRAESAARDARAIEAAAEAVPLTPPFPGVRPMLRQVTLLKAVRLPARPPTGWDRSRFIFQDGRLIGDNVNYKGLDTKRVYCMFRFDEEVAWGRDLPAGTEFSPARQFNLRHGIVLESDQYKVDGSSIRSVSCIRRDGGAVSPDDIVKSFGADLVKVGG